MSDLNALLCPATKRLCVIFAASALIFLPGLSYGDADWLFAVQITADIQVAPPQIRLMWEIDPTYPTTSFTIYRKAKIDTGWGNPIATVSGSSTTYTDNNVAAGEAYEYQIYRAGQGYTGYGYIFAGINTPLTEGRGKIVLLVESSMSAPLATELSRLQTDLVGDGWQVMRHDVSSNDSPAYARSLVINDYNADPSNVQAVFLFGHLPILQSGYLNYDTHGYRAMPADTYYGDINGDWSASPSYLPSDVELMVGRVDLANMPGNAAPGVMATETQMLRTYLNKDHNWRFRQISVQRRAILADRFGYVDGQAVASSGYRNFTPFVGHGNIVFPDWSDGAAPSQRWISYVAAGTYLWSYACGGGQDTSMSEMGVHGQYNDCWSTDIVGQDAKAVFSMFEGSWFGNWDHTDNYQRSMLATPSMGLAVCCIAGDPHWFVHHMGLGETIGYSARLTMNNSTLYKGETNLFTRAVYITLLGDPTLRMEPVAPSGTLAATPGAGTVSLNWSASTDPVVGYNIYRSAQANGPYTRLNGAYVSGTSYADSGLSPGTYSYMVRAIRLQTNFCGSYYNPSQGMFAAATVSGQTTPPITVQSTRLQNGVSLTWNSASGITYRVLGKTNMTQATWSDLSGTITATGVTCSWSDSNAGGLKQRFYCVASP